MVVHSCYVDDTNGESVSLIGGNGCAEDLNLLNNLDYSSDLMGGVETHVFKYADRAELYFQCQVSLFVKEPSAACPRPNCPEPASRGAGSANQPEGPIPQSGQEVFPLRPGSPYLPLGRLADFVGLLRVRQDQERLQPGSASPFSLGSFPATDCNLQTPQWRTSTSISPTAEMSPARGPRSRQSRAGGSGK